jgi:hypothetical protein
MRYAMRIYFLVLCLTLLLSGRAVAQYAAPAEEEIHRRVGELLSKSPSTSSFAVSKLRFSLFCSWLLVISGCG